MAKQRTHRISMTTDLQSQSYVKAAHQQLTGDTHVTAAVTVTAAASGLRIAVLLGFALAAMLCSAVLHVTHPSAT